MKTKVGKQRVTLIENDRKQSVTLSAFEDFNALAGLAQIELKGRKVGVQILQKGKRYCFVFGFVCNGIHDTLRPDQIPPTLRSFEAALKELPIGERMTVQLSSFTSDRDRQKQLDHLLNKAPSVVPRK